MLLGEQGVRVVGGTVAEARGVLTLAFGSLRYLRMALDLARSIRRNSPTTSIALVTDLTRIVPTDLFDHILPLNPAWGAGLEQKLRLESYTPYEATLYIDSDCLVVRSLDQAFDALAGAPFGVCGAEDDGGLWFGADMADVLRRVGCERFIRFNGGLMHWESGSESAAVFAQARGFAERYGELGFKAFRDELPVADEPLISLAMSVTGWGSVVLGDSIMKTPIDSVGPIHVDVLRGTCRFMKKGRVVEPAVPHFCGDYARQHVYRRECRKLRLAERFPQVPAGWLALAAAGSVLPGRARTSAHRRWAASAPRRTPLDSRTAVPRLR